MSFEFHETLWPLQLRLDFFRLTQKKDLKTFLLECSDGDVLETQNMKDRLSDSCLRPNTRRTMLLPKMHSTKQKQSYSLILP